MNIWILSIINFSFPSFSPFFFLSFSFLPSFFPHHLFISFFFLEQFQVHTTLKGRHRDFLHTSCPCTCIDSIIIYIPYQSDTFVTIDEPTLTHNNYLKFIVKIMVHSWYYTFYVFEQIT